MNYRNGRPEFTTDAERIWAARRYLKFAYNRLDEAQHGMDQTKTAGLLRIAERWRERAGQVLSECQSHTTSTTRETPRSSADLLLMCGGCGEEFPWTTAEQRSCRDRNVKPPRRCVDCRRVNQSEQVPR